ncbi:MAG TPA: hypothetical protein VF183_05565 [Acidimicrobiales bacterium]
MTKQDVLKALKMTPNPTPDQGAEYAKSLKLKLDLIQAARDAQKQVEREHRRRLEAIAEVAMKLREMGVCVHASVEMRGGGHIMWTTTEPGGDIWDIHIAGRGQGTVYHRAVASDVRRAHDHVLDLLDRIRVDILNEHKASTE